ncbi:hypothetical protein HZB78_00400 [Candidatus Collierbacteria bacterium]|nr:hypothetical protein [Candidatus Collierbacteria bacterium]
MSKSPDFDSPEFLRLSAANLFVPGDEGQKRLAIELLAKAGFHPERHNVGATRIERIDGQDVVLRGEFIAIAGLGLEANVEKRAQKCMEALGIAGANTQLLWATSSLEIFDIRRT